MRISSTNHRPPVYEASCQYRA